MKGVRPREVPLAPLGFRLSGLEVFTLARDLGLSEAREPAFADSHLGERSSASPDSVGPQGVRPVDTRTIGSRRRRSKMKKIQ